jgi:hypothetical protein
MKLRNLILIDAHNLKTTTKEIWKWVIIYYKGNKESFIGHYRVSNYGRIKSVRRRVRNRRGYRVVQPRILKPSYCGRGKGHLCVSLIKPGQTGRRYYVHHLVLWAFVGPCPMGMQTRHLDDNSTNNCVQNLRWGTQEQNSKDALKNGRRAYHKLTEGKVKKIKTLHTAGKYTQMRLGRRFGVSQNLVSLIVRNKVWTHVV